MRHNHIGILSSVILQQALGFLWYSPYMFSEAWLEAQGKTIEQIDPTNPIPFAASIVAAFMGAYAVSIVFNWTRHYDFKGGFQTGLVAGGLIAAPTLLHHYQFLGHNLNLFWIDGSKEVVGYLITGIILAIWPPKPKRIFT